MDTQTQVERLIELAIIQRAELKRLVDELPTLRDHLNAEVERTFEECEPQIRTELEAFSVKCTTEQNQKLSAELEAKIASLAKGLQDTAQAKFSAVMAEREKNAELLKLAEGKIADAAAALPATVKEIVAGELSRFPRADQIDQLRKEFAEPRGLNPRGKWQSGETYNRLDLVSFNGDSFVSSIDGNTEKPNRNGGAWTLSAARGSAGYGGGGGITSLNDILNVPTTGQIIGSQNGQYVPKTLAAGANITITENANTITIIGDEGQITLQDGTAAAPSLFFQNDTDTGIYRPAANTLGISVSGTQVAYFDPNGLTIPTAGIEAGGSLHAANGNANNPSLSFTGDQDTGFFRHQPNELGVALGGTQYATLTSTTFSVTPALSVAGVSRVTNSTASTSTSTGALVVTGGVGIGGAANVGGNLGVTGNITATGGTVESASSIGNSGFVVRRNTNPYIDFYDGGNPGTIRGEILATNDGVSGGSLVFSTRTAPGVITTALTLDKAANATLAGNLTVSGTGNSSFAGQLGIGVVPRNSNATITSLEFTAGSLANYSTSVINLSQNNAGDDKYLTTNPSSLFQQTAGKFVFYTAGSGTAGTAISYTASATLANNGNLLLGTTTDSSNGKLQLATHTTSAGGIGFGSDVSLYRATTGVLGLNGSTDSGLLLYSNGGLVGRFYVPSGGNMVLDYPAGKSLLLRDSSGTTALTLDSSQNATFAGSVSIKSTSAIKGVRTATATFDFGTIASGDASSVCSVTISGATASDTVIVNCTDSDNFPQFCIINAVPVNGSVSVRLYNPTASSKTIGSRTIRVTAISF